MSSGQALQKLIAELEESREKGLGATLLIGDGCSVRAGFPTEAEWVEVIRKKHPRAYENAKSKELKACAAELTASQREELYQSMVQKAKLNWAHLGIAMLMKAGYIGRVVTASVNPFVMKSCALLHCFPSVYDCTTGMLTRPDQIAPQAVIHLKGQVLGAAPGALDGVMTYLSKRGPWLVVGFEPPDAHSLVDQIAKMPEFDHGLFWVLSEGARVSTHVDDKILKGRKDTVSLSGNDPDGFIMSLTQELKVPVPEVVAYPFTFLADTIRKVAPFPVPGQREPLDVTDISIYQAKDSIQRFEGPDRGEDLADWEDLASGANDPDLMATIQKARMGLISGMPEKVLKHRDQYDRTPSAQLADLLIWAFFEEGDASYQKAREVGPQEVPGLLARAEECYRAAQELKPDHYGIQHKLGCVIMERYKVVPAEQKMDMLDQAIEKFHRTLDLKPGLHEAQFRWGLALMEKAGMETGEEAADALYAQAIEKFQETLKARPGNGEAAFGCGLALFSQARRRKGAEALRLYGHAIENFQVALRMHPNRREALMPMGQALLIFSRSKKGEEADRMLFLACEKFQAVVKLNPDSADALSGLAEAQLAKSLLGMDPKSDELFDKAMESFQGVVDLKPEWSKVFLKWGNGLLAMADKKQGKEVAELLNLAAEKFQAYLKQKPKSAEGYNRLGHVFYQLSKGKQGIEADALLAQAAENYQTALKLQGTNFEAITNWGLVSFHRAMDRQGSDAVPLLKEAVEKFKSALKTKPDYLRAFTLWGNALYQLAQHGDDREKERLFQEAEEKYQKALEIQPDDAIALTNWGAILLNKAKNMEGSESSNVTRKALEKLQAALEIQADNAEALNWMADALMEQAKTKRGINAHPLLAEAKGKLMRVEELQPGLGCFNMARLMAQLANESACREWLKRCKENGTLPRAEEMERDPLLESVRDSNWFRNLARQPRSSSRRSGESAAKTGNGAQHGAERGPAVSKAGS